MLHDNALKVKNFIENLPKLIRNNQDQFEPYFITFTFKDSFGDVPKELYRIYFSRFYQKFNQLAVDQPSKNKSNYSRIILIPEPSYSESKMHRHPHFHGILLVKKTQSKNFLTKCLSPLKLKKNRYGDYVWAHDLSDNLIGKMMQCKLKLFTTDIRPVDDIQGVCRYIGKKLIHPL